MADEQAGRDSASRGSARAASRVRRSEPAPCPTGARPCVRGSWSPPCCAALWTVAIEADWSICRCSSTANGSARRPPAREHDRAAGASAATSSTATAACSPTRSMPIHHRGPVRIEKPSRGRELLRALDAAMPRAAGDCGGSAQGPVRLGRAQGVARRGVADRALEIKGIGFVKESQRFYPKRELLPTSSVTSVSTTSGSADSSRRSTPDSRQARPADHPARRRGARELMSRVEREPTAAHPLELTIDEYLQNIAERELQAGVEENRRHRRLDRRHGSRVPANSCARELRRRSIQTSTRLDGRPAPQSRHPGPLRARIDVQDRDGVSRPRRGVDDARRHDRRQRRAYSIWFRADRRHASLRHHCRSPTSS